LEDGRTVPWIDENLNPATGDWISRTRLKNWKNGTWDAGKGGEERGKDYNHSTYCDLIISGLVGLRPRADETVEVNPLVPEAWEYFCLDQVRYHGRWLTILWDKTGERYRKGKGLRIFADGKEVAASETLVRVTAPLPPREAPPGGGRDRRRVGEVRGQPRAGRQTRYVLRYLGPEGRRHVPHVVLVAAQEEPRAGGEQGRHPLERAGHRSRAEQRHGLGG
jgi:hypothetical protein